MEENKKITKFRFYSTNGQEFMIKDVIWFSGSDNMMTFQDIDGKKIIVNANNIIYIVAEDQEASK